MICIEFKVSFYQKLKIKNKKQRKCPHNVTVLFSSRKYKTYPEKDCYDTLGRTGFLKEIALG